MPRLRAPFALALTAVAVAPTPPASAEDPTSEAADAVEVATLAHLEVALESLPIAVHRRAVDFLEHERDRPSSPWVGARLSDRVLPMVRPGDVDPTYYEVRVESGDGSPLGYFVLATGEHDHPIPVAVEEGPPRSRLLEAELSPGAVVERVNFFGAVSQVAEGARGDWLAGVGGLPVKVDDLGATQAQLGEWRSWDELRTEYVDNYREAHDIMRRNAADDWDDLRQGQELAEGLQPGWFREIPILGRGGATIRLEGAGRDLVRTERYERIFEGDEVVSVFVEDFVQQGVFPVDVFIDYADGSTEVRHLAITKQVPALSAAGGLGGVLAAPDVGGVVGSTTDGVECSKVVVRSAYDTYLYARDGGGSTLEAKGGWIGGWEVFRLEATGGDSIALRSSGGQYVRSAYDSGPTITVDGKSVNAFTKFHRINLGDGAVELRTFYKHDPLHAHQNGTVNASIDADERRRNRMFLEYCSPNRITSHWAGADDPITAMKRVRKYDQLEGNQAPNKAPCASGCGATVWAMVFGWADHMAARNDSTWRDYKKLYSQDGDPSKGDVGAPEFMWTNMPSDIVGHRATTSLVGGVGNIVEEIRSYMDDWGAAGCTVTGSRFTAPHIMAQARQYLDRRGVDIGMHADYDGLGIMTAAGKANVLSQIRDHDRVAAMGIDWFGHYPLAYGYEHARFAAWNAGTGMWSPVTNHHRFVVNMGWGKYGSANVPYDSWFSGYLVPRTDDKSGGDKSGDDKSGTTKSATSKKGVRKGRFSKKLWAKKAKKKSKKKSTSKNAPKSKSKSKGKALPKAPNRVLPPPA